MPATEILLVGLWRLHINELNTSSTSLVECFFSKGNNSVAYTYTAPFNGTFILSATSLNSEVAYEYSGTGSVYCNYIHNHYGNNSSQAYSRVIVITGVTYGETITINRLSYSTGIIAFLPDGQTSKDR